MIGRVLVITTSYPLRPDSSAGVFVEKMVDAYRARLQPTVLCPDDDGLPSPARDNVFAFRYAPKRWQCLAQGPGGVLPALRANRWLVLLLPFFFAAMIWRGIRLARRNEVLHANWAVCGAVAAIVAKVSRTPCVVTLRGSDVALAGRSRLQAWLLRRAVRASAAVVCVSEDMSERVRQLHPAAAGRVRTILNGVDDTFLSLAPPATRTRGTTIGLLSIGSLVSGKGFDLLLDALSRIEAIDWQLQVVGDGPERGALVKQADRLGLAARVHFVGAVPPAEIPSYFVRSDVFVLASRSEGRSNVVLEAMAAAMPIVASEIPGIVELVASPGHAWLFKAGDGTGLTDALASAMADPDERERRGAAARRRVRDQGWTWEGTGAAYAELFAGMITERQRQAG